MKYIKQKSNVIGQNLKPVLTLEAFENDITWGGSLLGRLINSTIRRSKIYLNDTQIKSVVEKVKMELDTLLGDYLSNEDREKVRDIKWRFLIEEIYKVVESDKELKIKLSRLLGNSEANEGLINTTITEVENTNIDDKEVLLGKLKKFRDELLESKKELPKNKELNAGSSNKQLNAGENNKQLNAGASNKQLNAGAFKEDEYKKLEVAISSGSDNKLEVIDRMLFMIDNAIDKYTKEKNSEKTNYYKSQKEKYQKEKEEQEKNKQGSKQTYKKQTLTKEQEKELIICFREAALLCHPDRVKTNGNAYKELSMARKNNNLELVKSILSDLKSGKYDLGSPSNESRILNYQRFMIINEDESIENDETNAQSNLDTNKKEEIPENSEETPEQDKVKKAWNNNFESGEEKKWKVNEEEANKLKNEIENKEISIDYDKNKDPIIRIANLFAKAHKLFTADVIPSGRPDGKISQKTYREYRYLGEGKPDVPSSSRGPGFGPWGVRLTMDKWRDGITKLLENKEYRRILANAKFVSNAEITTNTKMSEPGSGKTLFTFVNNLLDSSLAGDFDKQRRKLFSDYFGTPYESKKGENVEKNKNRETPTASDDVVWQKITTGEIKKDLITEKRFIALQSEDKKIYVMYIYHNSDNGVIPFKFQKNNQSISNKYLGKSIPVLPGCGSDDLANVYIAAMDYSNINVGNTIKIKYADVAVNTNDPKDSDIKSEEIKVKNIWWLKDTKKNIWAKVIDGVKGRPSRDVEIIYEKYKEKIKPDAKTP